MTAERPAATTPRLEEVERLLVETRLAYRLARSRADTYEAALKPIANGYTGLEEARELTRKALDDAA